MGAEGRASKLAGRPPPPYTPYDVFTPFVSPLLLAIPFSKTAQFYLVARFRDREAAERRSAMKAHVMRGVSDLSTPPQGEQTACLPITG